MSKEIVLEVRDDISEKNTIFHVFSYKSIASGALVLVIIVIADYKPHGLVLQMLHVFIIFFITYFLMSIILIYLDIKIENNSSHLNDTI